MVQNVPYFRDKGDSNSSAGWKVVFTLLFPKFFVFMSHGCFFCPCFLVRCIKNLLLQCSGSYGVHYAKEPANLDPRKNRSEVRTSESQPRSAKFELFLTDWICRFLPASFFFFFRWRLWNFPSSVITSIAICFCIFC